MTNHEYSQTEKCIYCGSTKLMVEKYKWKCTEERVPKDRFVNEEFHRNQGIREAKERLKSSKDPWKRILYQVYDDEAGYSGLNELEKKCFCMNVFIGEIYNGGLEQYFGNSSGNYVENVLKFLKEWNLLRHHEILSSVVEIGFGTVNNASNRNYRSERLYGNSRFSDDLIWSGENVKWLEKNTAPIESRLVEMFKLLPEN